MGISARALTSDELLLVVNRNVPKSQQLANDYIKARKVPADRVVALDLPTTEQMSFDTYERKVAPPLRQFLRRNDAQNQVKCLLTFYGVPFRVEAHVNTAEETAELKTLHQQLAMVMDRLKRLVGDSEAIAATNDASFKALVPGAPLADPEGPTAVENLARRVDYAGKSIMESIGRIRDPNQQQIVKEQMLALVKRFTDPIPDEAGAAASTRVVSGAASRPASESASPTAASSAAASPALPPNTPAEREALEDRRYDPESRQTLRRISAQHDGVFNYAKLLIAQIGYLSTADSEAATDSELSLLKYGFYARARWQLNTLNYRLNTGPTAALMVSRLDAPDPQIVKQMIADSIAAEQNGLHGKVVIDSRGLGMTGDRKELSYEAFDQSLRDLAAIVHLKTKLQLVFDERPEVLPPHSADDVAVYCGWYSVGHYIPSCTFVPGAVGFHIASYEMVSLRDPGNTGWVRGLLKDGVAATLGPVAEPYLQAFPLPSEFFPLLLTGKMTLAEIYWRTELMSSWRMCLVGDPLYRPFAADPALKVSDLSPRLQRAFLMSDAGPASRP